MSSAEWDPKKVLSIIDDVRKDLLFVAADWKRNVLIKRIPKLENLFATDNFLVH
jgi:hypothetical protein